MCLSGEEQVEGEIAIVQWTDACVCRGKGQVTVALGRVVSQNETHSRCGYKNERCG